MATVELDAEFWTLPLETVRSAALDRARALGCEHAEARIERIRSQVVSLRDGRLETSADDLELGVGLRLSTRARSGSRHGRARCRCRGRARRPGGRNGAGHGPAMSERVELAEEPSHGESTWTLLTISTRPR